MLLEVDPENHRKKKRRQRKRVLELRDPRDRLDQHRMNHKDKPSQPSPAQSKLIQKAPDQQATDQMQNDIGQVIAKRVIAPEMPLQPDHTGLDRLVIDQVFSGLEPDFPQARGIMHDAIRGDQQVVVSEPCAMKSWRINPQAQREN